MSANTHDNLWDETPVIPGTNISMSGFSMIHNKDDKKLPSQKWTDAEFSGLFCGFFVVCVIFVALLMYCSKRQEEKHRDREQGMCYSL